MKRFLTSIALVGALVFSSLISMPAKAAPIVDPTKFASVVVAQAPLIFTVGAVALVGCLISELATPGDNYNGFCSPGKQPDPVLVPVAFVDHAALASGSVNIMTRRADRITYSYNDKSPNK